MTGFKFRAGPDGAHLSHHTIRFGAGSAVKVTINKDVEMTLLAEKVP